jgi:hypothetical protein
MNWRRSRCLITEDPLDRPEDPVHDGHEIYDVDRLGHAARGCAPSSQLRSDRRDVVARFSDHAGTPVSRIGMLRARDDGGSAASYLR